jgi:hypothetical protein
MFVRFGIAQKMIVRCLMAGAALIFVSLAGGCSDRQTITVPVSGHIAFGGGACPAEGTIVFSPIAVEKGLPRRPGTAKFQQDGAFTVTSFREGDGLIPGHYRPIVNCWKGEPRNDDPSSFERLNYVPMNYKASDIVVSAEDKSVIVALDVPKK